MNPTDGVSCRAVLRSLAVTGSLPACRPPSPGRYKDVGVSGQSSPVVRSPVVGSTPGIHWFSPQNRRKCWTCRFPSAVPLPRSRPPAVPTVAGRSGSRPRGGPAARRPTPAPASGSTGSTTTDQSAAAPGRARRRRTASHHSRRRCTRSAYVNVERRGTNADGRRRQERAVARSTSPRSQSTSDSSATAATTG